MSTSVKVKLKPTSVIESGLGIEENGPAHAYFTQQCAEHMDKYVPYNEGNLSRDSRVIETAEIRYEAPYAHYLYVGDVMGPNIPIKENGMIVGWFSKAPKYYTGAKINYNQDAGHPFAGAYWDKEMWNTEKAEVEKEVEEYIKKHGGKS